MLFGWKRQRRVVYTCMFGYSEAFNDFAYERDAITDFICFTDDPELRSSFWNMRVISRGLLDPPRASKRIKHLPHRFLSNYGLSLYLDNTVRLQRSPAEIFTKIDKAPIVCFRHPWRNCVYDEAEEILANKMDDARRIEDQMSFYRRVGYPARNGLTAGTVRLRRHMDERLIAASEMCFEQLLRFSMRDQLSFDVAAWLNGLTIDYFAGDLSTNDLIQWPVVNGPRVPRNFDDEAYLQQNPQVQCDPRLHFLRSTAGGDGVSECTNHAPARPAAG